MNNETIISGYYNNTSDLDNISKYIYKISKNMTTANHIWIDKINDDIYKTIDKVRKSNDLYKIVKDKFPNYRIKNITEVDEIYYSASPKNAKNSDRSLVDCHYDGPFAIIPNNNIIFYRIIVACNLNKDVSTTFPNNNIEVIMDKGDFHGLDYNKDLHCVEGSIPKKHYRVLLKLHYILIPNNYDDNTFSEKFVRYINVSWTKNSREFMRMSANPKNIFELIIGNIVNISRYIFNNIYTFIFIIIFIIIIILLYKNYNLLNNSINIFLKKKKLKIKKN
jgi:hypothetical protein